MIRLVEEIGTGWLGPMWRGEHQGESYRLMPFTADQYALRYDMAQRQIHLSGFVSDGILPNLGVVSIDGVHHWIGSWIDGHSLRDLMLASTQLSPKRIGALGVAVCAALHDLHQNQLVHGCLEPEMILLSADGRVLLEGNACPPTPTSPPMAGCMSYRPPEAGASQSGDVFSLGLILLEMALGRLPEFPKVGASPLIDAALRSLQAQTPVALLALLKSMLHENPERRPSAISLNASFKSFCRNLEKDILIDWADHSQELSSRLFNSSVADDDEKTELFNTEQPLQHANEQASVTLPVFEPAEQREEQAFAVAEAASDALKVDSDYSTETAKRVQEDSGSGASQDSSFFDEPETPSQGNSKSLELDSLFDDGSKDEPGRTDNFFDFGYEEEELSLSPETVEIETTAGFRKPLLIGFGVAALALSAWAVVSMTSKKEDSPDEPLIEEVAKQNASKGKEASVGSVTTTDDKKVKNQKSSDSIPDKSDDPGQLVDATKDAAKAKSPAKSIAKTKDVVQKKLNVQKVSPVPSQPTPKPKANKSPVVTAKPTVEKKVMTPTSAVSSDEPIWGEGADDESVSPWGSDSPAVISKTQKAPSAPAKGKKAAPSKSTKAIPGGMGRITSSCNAKVTLKKSNKTYSPGNLPKGRYQVRIKFKGQAQQPGGYIFLKEGETRRINKSCEVVGR